MVNSCFLGLKHYLLCSLHVHKHNLLSSVHVYTQYLLFSVLHACTQYLLFFYINIQNIHYSPICVYTIFNLYGAPEFTTGFQFVLCCIIFSFLCNILQIAVCPFLLFQLTFALCTSSAYDCPFGIFKPFVLLLYMYIHTIQCSPYM